MITFNDMRVLSAVENRRQSLLEDGYRVLFEHQDDLGYFVKMRHNNGTIVSLTANTKDGTIKQSTNGKVTHTEKVHQP